MKRWLWAEPLRLVVLHVVIVAALAFRAGTADGFTRWWYAALGLFVVAVMRSWMIEYNWGPDRYPPTDDLRPRVSYRCPECGAGGNFSRLEMHHAGCSCPEGEFVG